MNLVGINPHPKKISKIDRYTFTIEWNDGKLSTYRFFELQQKCPCANCSDPQTGERKEEAMKVDPKVTAESVEAIGRYALKFNFSDGCHDGIFSFNYLYEL